jgi:hypothetical protein
MALYRMFKSTNLPKKKSSFLTPAKSGEGETTPVVTPFLKTLWLYELNPAGVALTPEILKILRRFAIGRGHPPDYLITGFRAFNSVTAIEEYQRKIQLICELNEQLFLAWWNDWLHIHFGILQKKRVSRFKKKKKNISQNLFENPKVKPVEKIDFKEKGLFNTGLKLIETVKTEKEPAAHVGGSPLPFTQNHTQTAINKQPQNSIVIAHWNTLYTQYSEIETRKKAMDAVIFEYKSALKKLYDLFSVELKKQGYIFSEIQIETLIQTLMEHQIKPTEIYHTLKQNHDPLPPGDITQVVDKIAKKQTMTMRFRLSAIMKETGEFANKELEDSVNDILKIWESVYLKLTPSFRGMQSKIDVEKSNLKSGFSMVATVSTPVPIVSIKANIDQ